MGQISPEFSNQPDEVLWQRAAQGDASAEETLIRRYYHLIRSCIRPLFLSGGDSEDLMQEGLLGLLSAIRAYRPEEEAAFKTFAEVCIRSRLLSAVRAAGRAKHRPLNTSLPLEEREAEPTDPEALIIARESFEERLHQLSTQLSDFERQVLLRYLNGLSYSEIAALTHRSAKSVDNAVQRIRRKLTRH